MAIGADVLVQREYGWTWTREEGDEGAGVLPRALALCDIAVAIQFGSGSLNVTATGMAVRVGAAAWREVPGATIDWGCIGTMLDWLFRRRHSMRDAALAQRVLDGLEAKINAWEAARSAVMADTALRYRKELG